MNLFKMTDSVLVIIFFSTLFELVASQAPLPITKIEWPANIIVVNEDLPIGTLLAKLSVTGGEHPRLNSSSEYVSLIHTLESLTYATYDAILIKALDYETMGSTVSVPCPESNDYYSKIPFILHVYITDVNDETPVFLNRPYSINVAENATVGHVVYDLIKANDADLSDRQLKYYFEVDPKITDTDYKSKFVINQSTAQVTLNETLDYETARFYQYTVVVRDSNKHNATTDVFITIEDVQDEPPYFTGTPYLISVQENSKVGTSLLVVKAEDGDRGLSNSVTYKILNETCPGLFEITPASGEVRLKSVPDRDKGIVHDNNGICTLTVEAKEGQTYPQSIPGRDVRTEEVTIAIEDVDDNEPQFNLKSYDAIVAENTPNGVPITLSSAMKVEDIDQGPNAHFNVRVLNLTNEFEASPSIVQSTADIIIRVKDTNYLDYEKREKILILIEAKPVNAADSATGNTVVVTLNLTNVNDETPKFRSFQQTVSVQENVVIHYTVATVLANDTDQNDDGQNFGKVTYRIDPPDANFGIDSTSGLISTKTTLDRETKDSYYITIVAEDGGHSKVTNQMLIKITDVNDNSPSFVTDDYQTSLQEMDTKFARPVMVHATDNDEPGSPNSKVSYLIVSSTPSNLLTHFSMDSSSGALTVKSPLLYENVFSGHGQNQGNIILIVMAKDNGVPPRNSTVNVTVMLQDINNQPPVCSQSKYTTSRAEDSVLDVATVHATDKDGTAPNNLILYSIDQSSSEKFIIDSSSGKITLRSQLDREVQHHYIIAVTVTDLGNPPLNGSCQVEVEVTDVNDSPPVFKEKAVTTNINENTIFSYELVANDSDLNPNLSYSIDWDKSSGLKVNGESVDGSELKNWIQIQDPHHCKVISKKNFDRETITKMTIELLVKDLNGKVNVPQTDSATLVVDILDVNDNAPFLNGGPTLVASVRENMPINSSVTFVTPTSLEITDPDEKGPNSEYQVKIEDVKNIFDISPTLGEGHQTFTIVVKNSTALDYEKIQSHTVKIIAKNQALSTTATVTINILNENDNVPLFEKSTYSASVAEMSPPHANVTSSIKAIDKDLGSYGVVSYFLTDDSGKFQIDKNTGYVSTRTGDLDRETKSSYTLIITAKDVNGFSSLTQLTVTVTDINDQSPVFDQQNFAVTIEEGEKKFLPSFFVHATDADDPKSPNSQVEYSLIHATTAPLSNFNLGSASGELLMLSPLNFEALSNNGVIVLHVQAKDKGQPAHSSNATITVTVLDINDEKPVFPKRLYSVNISESASTGQSVTQLHATDKDKSSTNNQVSYSIDALSNSKFSINATTGEITVKDVLDREQVDHYSIIVTAADNGQPVQTSTATVSVTVTDVNDSPPQFYKKSVSVQITENVHQVITDFDARDADLNPDLVYSIEWSSSSGVDGHGQFLSGDTLKGFITINRHTGEVSTVNVLDRESIQRFQLTVQVQDVNGTTGTNQLDNAVLTVVVDDVNDNPPKFNGGPHFTAEVQENLPNGSEVKLDGVSGLYIEDPDGVNNNIFNITVSQNKAFSIGPLIGTGSSTCVIKVADSTLLDYEKVQSFTITVVAYDTKNRSLSSEATILIKLINENDNIPEFIGAPFQGKISENSKSGTHITTVKAHDADLGLFGQISYFLTDDANKFVINSTTGEVYSLVDDLDRETEANYILTVLAKDYSNFTAQAQLSIDVTDIDDETPVFLNLAYEYNINEGEIKSLTGFYVHANDADDPTTANSIVNYTLIHTEPNNYSSYFNMNISTGELMILKALDYEELVSQSLTAVTLTVQATDQGLAALSATSHIRVKVLDTNDNSPIFGLNPYSFSVLENSIKGTGVGRVIASDKDASVGNNEVLYMLDASSALLFEINALTGQITVTDQLDREVNEFYNIIVTAFDNGFPSRTSTAVVHVEALDANDTPPRFIWNTKLEFVKENFVGTLASNPASDPDLTADLHYFIIWSESSGISPVAESFSYKYIKSYLDINETTGEVYTLMPLDREIIQRIQLALLVIDVNGISNSQNDTAFLSIIIEDENDNGPKFIGGDRFIARIPENMPKDTELKLEDVLYLTVIDCDAVGNNKYSVSLHGSHGFTLSPSEGEGQTIFTVSVADESLLDYERRQEIILFVTATDLNSTGIKSVTATITVQIINENDNVPQFIGLPFHANLVESSSKNTIVYKIQAEDNDLGVYGQLSYFIADGFNKFGINPNTGIIFTQTADIDREDVPLYTLTVTAMDGGSFKTVTQLTIHVTDINDHVPTFQKSNYSFEINSRFVPERTGLFVQAYDLDESNSVNSNITYQLLTTGSDLESSFGIDPSSGEFYVNLPLENEQTTLSKKVVWLQVQAKDKGLPSLSSTATISVTIIYDNHLFLLSDVAVGNVTATDKDGTSPNNEIYYVIQSGSQDKFQIDSTSGMIKVGLGATLDREAVTKYFLTVLAVDRGTPSKSSSTQVNITVTDVNDEPPVILKATSLVGNVREDAKQNCPVMQVSASDLDVNNNLQYYLFWNESKASDEKDRNVDISRFTNWFEINGTTGEIYVYSTLDRETAQQIILKIVVQDMNAEQKAPQTATASATILLTDVNDNRPVIHLDGQQSMLHLNVSEGTKIGTEVTTLLATDADKDQDVTFSVNDSYYFTISPNGRLKLNKPLDRENQSTVSFIIVAQDNGNPPLSSNITVDITVLDINDNDPEFIGNQTVFQVLENSNLSTSICNITATDKDEGANALVTYMFRDETALFNISSQTGKITVAGSLDREKQSVYTLTVLATDNPELEQRRRASLVIQIELLDVNDNDPHFNIPPGVNYIAKIAEDRKINDIVNIQPQPISATDADVGQNAKVTYSLVPSNVSYFNINPQTGQVFVNESMLGAPGDYSLEVKAIDQGDPPRSNLTNLHITILDVNNNNPYFVNSDPFPSIPECTGLATVVYTFKAADNDTDKTSNALVKYYLLNSTEFPDAGYFLLNPDSGKLSLEKKLSSEQKDLLKIQVQAEDSGDPPRKSEVLQLNINVLDINDHPPEFIENQNTLFSVKEESIGDVEIGTVFVTDRDKGSQLKCVIDDPVNPYKNNFYITTSDGKCTIKGIKPFDRENVSHVNLNLVVEDIALDTITTCKINSGIDTRFSSPKSVTINIVDINDNPPVFITQSLSKGFLSSSEVEKVILNLNDYVTDRDTDANSKHQFYQLGKLEADEDLSKGWLVNSLPDPIKVDINGSIKTNYKFPEDHYGAITLTVLVNDTAGNDTLNLKIFVVGSPQVVEFSFYKSEDELRRLQQDIAQELSDSSIEFVPDDIVSFKDENNDVDGSKSILLMHALQNGKIIDASHLKEILDHQRQKIETLQGFKIIKTETQEEALKMKKETNDNNRIQYILIGIIAAIALTFIITLAMLIHNIGRFKRKLKAATIEVHGLEPMKFPGLDNPLKDSNPIFNRDDATLDSDSDSGQNYDSYSQRSDNSLDKNALGQQEYAEDEQEVVMNMYGGDDAYADPSNLRSPLQYLNDVFVDDERSGPMQRHSDPSQPYDREEEDEVFDLDANQFESTDI